MSPADNNSNNRNSSSTSSSHASSSYPTPSLTNSLCILSPIKARESTFFRLGESSLRKFRLMDEEDLDVTYVAQLVIHINGSDEAIQPSLIPLHPTLNQAFSYSLSINLSHNSQLMEAILPHLSLHNTDSVQADISVYELIAVTRSLTESIYASSSSTDASATANNSGDITAITTKKRSSSHFLEVPIGSLASTVSRFSSSSTLVSTVASSTASSSVSSFSHDHPNKLRNWFCTHKDNSSILIRRFSKHIKKARALSPSALRTTFSGRGSNRSAEAAPVPTKMNLIELDMERWNDNSGSASAPLALPGSWASSVSLRSELSSIEDDKGVRAAVACATQVGGTVAMK